MTHKDYVSFEQAKVLKELGFDWETWCFYSNKDNQLEASVTTVAWNKESNDLSAPTLAQAQKWLREVKEFDIDITLFRDIDARGDKPVIKRYYNCEIAYDEDEENLYDDFEFYEQALSVGIDRALELLKEESDGLSGNIRIKQWQDDKSKN